MEAIATDGPATAAGIAQRCIKGGADLILAAGGDGTINEVVNGMVHSSVPLGILPAGTANVLANELAIGSTMERAAKCGPRLCEATLRVASRPGHDDNVVFVTASKPAAMF